MAEVLSAVITSAPYLLEGTIALVAVSFLIGFICGIAITLGQVYCPWIVKRIVDVRSGFENGTSSVPDKFRRLLEWL